MLSLNVRLRSAGNWPRISELDLQRIYCFLSFLDGFLLVIRTVSICIEVHLAKIVCHVICLFGFFLNVERYVGIKYIVELHVASLAIHYSD